MAKIAPSVLGADFSRIGDEIKSAVEAGADHFHLDIMDGHFVPNLSFGPKMVGTVDKLTDAFIDVHLMLDNPEKFFEPFARAGADSITFHIQVHPEPVPYVEQLRELGIQAGISLNPDVSFDDVAPYLEHFDNLLVMSVYPGFGGQEFIESVLPKIAQARDFIDSHGLKTTIAVDGGVDETNAHTVVNAGADILVMGSAFFGSNNRRELVKLVHELKRS